MMQKLKIVQLDEQYLNMLSTHILEMYPLTGDNLNFKLEEISCDYSYSMLDYLKMLLTIGGTIICTSIILLCIYLHYYVKCLFKSHIPKNKKKGLAKPPVMDTPESMAMTKKIKVEISNQVPLMTISNANARNRGLLLISQ